MPYKPWNAQKETVTAKKKKKETKLGKKNNENTQQVSNCRNDQQNYGLSKTGKYHAEFHTLLKKNPQCK